ncbi:RNA deprotection pyrophosphohydrolase [Aureibacillus halotolerans]|uniref:8-oxo-dGTPase n=1 Tax=Aureibacillus halotolerans TaxID=1508390 RepID=A0A4V3D5J0_9BACI|nr:nucleoside triphosphatase YtkD [Aureibacillus halotolerans]TDQ40297.1 8-oxo-dGTPase [Aureibacillus halotolerans]
MYTFQDYYHNHVKLSFKDNPFTDKPGHVLILCRYKGQWLFTKHPRRGIEFPGGKVEAGELPREAAVREVFEETGGTLSSLSYIGQYKVEGRHETIEKSIYYGTIAGLEKQKHYHETEGPVLFKQLPKKLKEDSRFSFHMRDEVVEMSIQHIKALFTI